MVAEVGKYYTPGEQKEQELVVTTPDGKTTKYSYAQAVQMGFNPKNLPDDKPLYSYRDAEGNTKLTSDITDVPMSISLNTETGNIELSVPTSIYNSTEFAQAFDEETLKKYSQAYKLNRDYKLTVMEENEETGDLEEKEISLPEYVEKLNSSLENFRKSLKQAVTYRNSLYQKYGDKALNMNLAQIQMSLQYDGDATYLPDRIFNVSSFGSKGNNPFREILDKVSEDGVVSVDELKKIYTRENFGREEIAGLLATIDGILKGSDWGKDDTITFEDGETVKNANSATEAAKLLAFKNFVLTHNPEAEWWQQAGDQIETFTVNAAAGVTRVFGNLADIGETVVTLGNSTAVHNAMKDMDEAMEYFNTNNAIVYDATANAQILGTLGGMALGTAAAAQIGSVVADKAIGLAGASRAAAVEKSYEALKGTETLAKTTDGLVKTALMAEEVSVGAKIAIASMTIAEKVSLATNVALAALGGAQTKYFITEFLFDTVHDALLYDFTTLRDVLIAINEDPSNPNKQRMMDYWLQQLGENAMFWAPFAGMRATFSGWKKVKTSTELGKAADVVITKYVNKFASTFGKYKQKIKDSLTGGNVVAKLERDLKKAEDAGDMAKVKHIRTELQIEDQNAIIRKARESLGDLKLDWDGVKLTDETYDEFHKLLTDIKNAENSIDRYRFGVESERNAMLNPQKDPATGKQEYLYPELAGANKSAGEWYEGLAKLNKKYGLGLADDGAQVSQEVADYWVGSYNEKRMRLFSALDSKNAADAQSAADIIKEDIEALRGILPEEIVTYIDNGVRDKIYQTYYHFMNEYGYSGQYKVLNPETVKSYEANPVWAEIGYMPVKVKLERTGKFISDDGTIDRIVDQEMDHLRFHAEPGQHYEDPELVRQIRTSHMAEAKVSAEVRHLYSINSNATFVQTVSGEEVELANRISDDVKTLAYRIETEAKIFSGDSNTAAIEIVKTKKRKGLKNTLMSNKTVDSIVTSMSPSDVSEYLFLKGSLDSPTSKLTDRVTQDNFGRWFSRQNDSVKKYLWANNPRGDIDNEFKFMNPKELDREIESAEKKLKKLNKQPKLELTSLKKTKDMTKKELKEHQKLKRAVQYENRKVKKAITDTEERLRLLNEAKKAGGITYKDLTKMMSSGGNDFEEGLERAYLMGDVEFASSSAINEAARNLENGRKAFEEGVLLTKVKGELRHILNIDTDKLADDLYSEINDWVDGYVERVVKDPGAKEALNTIAGVTDGGDDVAKALALKELQKPKNFKAAEKSIKDQMEKLYKDAGLNRIDDMETVSNNAAELFKGIVESRMDEANLVSRTISTSLADGENIFDKVAEINKRIAKAKSEKGVTQIVYMDDNGKMAYARVDPAFASLYDHRYRIERANAGVMARINGLMSKAFRYGTTSVNLASFGNQAFYDSGSAIVVGGSWNTIRTNADNLVDVFGRNVVEQIKQFEPDDFEVRQIATLAKKNDISVEQAAVSRELMRGQSRAPYTTERTLYKKFMKEAYGQGTYGSTPEELLENARTKLDQLVKKFNPEDLMNGKRENYLRNRVYASSLNDALREGYTLQQARTYAEFAMNNATTNFSRQLYHMQAIADSTPYFRAAINGTKSFWRMWSLDPVGITGRIMGGLIIPTMALTGHSLIDEKDREVYNNIPEYTKADSMVFVFNGQPMSIPLPREVSAIVAPFRQFVEHLHASSKEDFWELMMNDLLGFSPYDLQGFSAIDFDAMVSDPTILDRINRGTSRLFSQMAPVPVKTAYMLATGTDPYTGRNLRDREYMYWNEETGSIETMDYNSNSFAIWVAKVFGDSMSADLAEKIVSGVIGTTGSNLLGDITKTLQEGPLAGIKEAGTNALEQITKPISVTKYNLVDSIWKRAIRQLTTEKEALLSSKEMQALNNELSQTKDPEERKKILAKRQTLVDGFHQKVGDMIKRLESVYHGNFDRKKFAAVIALLNFNSDAGYQSGSMYSSYLASDQFWDGREAAVHTMQQLGVTGTSDMSIFGYLAVDSDGNTVVKYTSPVAIMDMENQWKSQGDMHLANIKALASQHDLWNKHQEMKNQVNAIYAKSKLTSADYDQIDNIYTSWNEEVMNTLAPYIERMTPEAAINNSNVLDYLDGLIEVPGSFKKDKYGRSVSDKKLGSGSAKQAYIKNYIRYIFGINDTGYSSGKNYSDRKEYDKENTQWR